MDGDSVADASLKLDTNLEMEVVEIEEENASLKSDNNPNPEMDAVEIEEESEALPAVAAAIPYDVAKEISCEDYSLDETGELQNEADEKHGKSLRRWTIFALVVAFILIFIAIVYQVEWNKQRIISELGPAHTRFSEAEAEASVEIILTTTPVTTTTTEYVLTDYYEEDNDENTSKSDSDEYDENEYRGDAPYSTDSEYPEGAKTATTPQIAFNVDIDINEIPVKWEKWSDCSMKRNFTLWPTNNDPLVGYLNGHCLQCICEASSDCSMSAKNGPFVISRPYWIDAGLPELNTNDYGYEQKLHTDDEKYQNCITDLCCAAETVSNFIQRFARDCNNDGKIDCTDHVMLHVLGPKGCIEKDLSAIHALRYDMCSRREYTMKHYFKTPF